MCGVLACSGLGDGDAQIPFKGDTVVLLAGNAVSKGPLVASFFKICLSGRDLPQPRPGSLKSGPHPKTACSSHIKA